ncbi:MAG: hypothetical protein LC641_02415 [Spirochaeta sp.]|nr:hypothetical protein [Spirochaeta sp.]
MENAETLETLIGKRISVARLCDLAGALGVRLKELLPEEVLAAEDSLTSGFSLTRDEIRLLKLYRKIESERMKKSP